MISRFVEVEIDIDRSVYTKYAKGNAFFRTVVKTNVVELSVGRGYCRSPVKRPMTVFPRNVGGSLDRKYLADLSIYVYVLSKNNKFNNKKKKTKTKEKNVERKKKVEKHECVIVFSCA